MALQKAPDAFRTISEVAEWLGVSAHVLRFWESKFSQIKPTKRAGGRRYYRVSDMELLGGIRHLLYEDGLTIKGAQKVLREKGVKAVAALSPPVEGATPSEAKKEVAPVEPAPVEPAPVEPTPVEPTPVEPVLGLERVREPTEDVQQNLFKAPEPVESSDGAMEPAPTPPPEPADLPAEPALPSAGPQIAPLPGERDLPLTEALARLAPGQIPRGDLAPILSRARALKTRIEHSIV